MDIFVHGVQLQIVAHRFLLVDKPISRKDNPSIICYDKLLYFEVVQNCERLTPLKTLVDTMK